MSTSTIINALTAANKMAVLSHYNPDADAYGSSCGLAMALRAMGKQVCALNESGIIPGFQFIPGVSEVKTNLEGFQPEIIIVCDCGDAERVGDTLTPLLKGATKVVNIDHHSSNTAFGAINWIVETASSTSELIYQLLTEAKFWQVQDAQAIKSVAIALYAGIAADTGSFRYSNTRASTFSAVEHLVSVGVEPAVIAHELFGRNSLAAVRLHAEALSKLELLADGKLCAMVVDEQMISKCGATKHDAEGLVEKGRDIEGVKISVLMRWDGELWRVSMRSVHDSYNVALVAQDFGGGGHKVAAAFRWRRPIAELKEKLLPALSAVATKGKSV